MGQLEIEHRVNVGLNYSNVLIYNFGEQSYIINGGKSGPFFKPGVHFGYKINSMVYRKMGFQTGLLYNQKGAKHYFDTPRLRIDYISVPIYILFKPIKKTIIIKGGFAWEFAVNANDQRIPISSTQPLIDKTIILGIEYKFLKTLGISLSFHETLNFYNFSRNGNSVFGDKNQFYQLSVFKSFKS